MITRTLKFVVELNILYQISPYQNSKWNFLSIRMPYNHEKKSSSAMHQFESADPVLLCTYYKHWYLVCVLYSQYCFIRNSVIFFSIRTLVSRFLNFKKELNFFLFSKWCCYQVLKFMTPDFFQLHLIRIVFSYKLIRWLRNRWKTWMSTKINWFYTTKSQQFGECILYLSFI